MKGLKGCPSWLSDSALAFASGIVWPKMLIQRNRSNAAVPKKMRLNLPLRSALYLFSRRMASSSSRTSV